MPSSPTMRCSPGRELRVENHKGGRSLESGILFRQKDDDLPLFDEVQDRERDNFLLQSNDDFEDMFSTKLRYFADHKLGLSIPVRGKSSDLLNTDGEKNDYDWLLTPPDTPLFTSLDDEAPPVTLARGGRPRSQPISISRSSTMERSYRSSRGSASPNRLSTSPRSANSTLQSRGRPSPAPDSSPTSSLPNTALSRRPSPPSSKQLTSVPRSSTPTSWGMNISSSCTVASSRTRGTCTVKVSRGNSASPKIRAWQSNIPGFSSEAPPNLRTSLADRPASYVRGSSPASRSGRGLSPASRNGRDLSSKPGRQSMSPTPSRSISSSYSHDGDRLSLHSKGSVASSGDNDLDSLQSLAVVSSDHLASKSLGTLANNRSLASSKKPTRIMYSSSAPKRSFDLAVRQMDHHKGPQNMFRPLLSSVPSSTFYLGKASAVHRAMVSRNSSITTSSNASSSQATSGAHDNEGSDQNQEDVTSGFVKAPDHDLQVGLFDSDRADALKEDIGFVIHDTSAGILQEEYSREPTVVSRLGDSENFSGHCYAMSTATTFKDFNENGDISGTVDLEDVVLCSKCGCKYKSIESIEKDFKLCPDCRRSNVPLSITTLASSTTVAENSSRLSPRAFEESESFEALESLIAVPGYPEVTTMDAERAAQHEKIVREGCDSKSETNWNSLLEDSLTSPQMHEGEHRLSNHHMVPQQTASWNISDGDSGTWQMQYSNVHPNIRVSGSEGAGISVLLKRSSSVKGHIVQSRTFAATSIPCDDISYVRNSINSTRSSLGHGSMSASSSVDLGSARQTDTRVQRQLSIGKSDIENYTYEINTKHQRTGSSVSGISNHAFHAFGLPITRPEDSVWMSGAHRENNGMEGTYVAPNEELLGSEHTEVDETYCDVENDNNFQITVASTTVLSSYTLNIQVEDNSVTSFSNFKESSSHENGDELVKTTSKILDVEACSIVEEHGMPNSCVDRVDTGEVPFQGSLDKTSDTEIQNGDLGSPGSQSDVASSDLKTSLYKLEEPSVPTASDKDSIALVAESETSECTHGILGEQGGTKARNLTLEEATDTLRFCSSIIQNLAYEAAARGMEKENLVPLEGSHPTVTILGKSSSDRKDQHGRMLKRRTSKVQKAKKRPVGSYAKPPGSIESDEKADISTTHIVGVPNKGDSMKPPKLESKCNCRIM